MDKIAIISDIHGNITALNAVLEDIKNRKINKIFCLGDCITKCTHPDLVIDKVKEVCDVILLGNCDYAICKPSSKNKNFWTRNCIGEERVEFMKSLPISYEFYMSGHLIRLFHASPYSLDEIYNPMFSNKNSKYSHLEITDPKKLFENTSFINKTEKDPIPDIVGYGHIHTPYCVRFENKTIFNTGSVGIPVEMHNNNINDKNNKFSTLASYIILEGYYGDKNLNSISFNLVRIPYNIQKEIEDLESSDIPNKNTIIKTLKSAISNNI